MTSRPAFVRQFELLDIQLVFPKPTVPRSTTDRGGRRSTTRWTGTKYEGWPGCRASTPSATCQLLPARDPGAPTLLPVPERPHQGPYLGPDLAKARALVTKSGTVGIPIVLRTGSRPEVQARGSTPRASCETGLPGLRRPGRGRCTPVRDRRYQIQSRLGWVPDYPQPGNYFDATVGCGASFYIPYCNRTIQALADRARSLRRTDPAESLALWAQVDRMLTDDAAVVPMINRVATVVVSPQVGNVINRDGFGPLLDQMWLR